MRRFASHVGLHVDNASDVAGNSKQTCAWLTASRNCITSLFSESVLARVCWPETNGNAPRNTFRNHGETHYIEAGDKPKTDSFNRRACDAAKLFLYRPSPASSHSVPLPSCPVHRDLRASARYGPCGSATSEMTIWAVDYLVWWPAVRALIRREMRTRCLRVPDARSPAETIRSTATRLRRRRATKSNCEPLGAELPLVWRRGAAALIGNHVRITAQLAAKSQLQPSTTDLYFCPWAPWRFKVSWRTAKSPRRCLSPSLLSNFMNMFRIKFICSTNIPKQSAV